MEVLGLTFASGNPKKVAFNYLRENYTKPDQPFIHGLVNFKPKLMPQDSEKEFEGFGIDKSRTLARKKSEQYFDSLIRL